MQLPADSFEDIVMQISIDKILVPTDFSANAAHAYPYAKRLAEAFGAKILITHVADITIFPVGPGLVPIGWESIAKEMMQSSRQRLEEVRAAFEGLDVELFAREGSAFVTLIELAEEQDVDLIVMSTHGHTGIKHLLMGSTAERVVRKAPCPVLTVHPDDREFGTPGSDGGA